MKRRPPHNILVVDDDPDLLHNLKDLLETRGYAVDMAETGMQAVEMSARTSYDLAVVDIILPDIEGTEVFRRMGKDSRSMKKIILTGHPNLENAIESIKQGVHAYLLKPIEPAEFLRVVEAKLKGKEKEEAFIENAVRQRMRKEPGKSDESRPPQSYTKDRSDDDERIRDGKGD